MALNAEHRDVALAAFDRLIAPAPRIWPCCARSKHARSRRPSAARPRDDSGDRSRRSRAPGRRRRTAPPRSGAVRGRRTAGRRRGRRGGAHRTRAPDGSLARRRRHRPVSTRSVHRGSRRRRAGVHRAASSARPKRRPSRAPARRGHRDARRALRARRNARRRRRARATGSDRRRVAIAHCRSSATARRPTDWQSDSPGRWPRAGSGTRWAPCWPRRARRSTRSSSRPKRLLSHDDAAAAAARWQALSREARGLTACTSLPTRVAPGRRSATTRLAASSTSGARGRARTAREHANRREAAAKAQQTLRGAAAAPGPSAPGARPKPTRSRSRGRRLMRDIGARPRDLADTVDRAGRRSTRPPRKLRTLQEQVAPRVRELREMDDWRRFANAQRRNSSSRWPKPSSRRSRPRRKQRQGRRTWRPRRARSASCTPSGTKWPRRRASPRSGCGIVSARATDFIRSRCETYFAQAARGTRRAASQTKTALVDRSRSARRVDRLGQGGRAVPGTAERVAGARARLAARPGRDLAQRFRTASQHVLRAAPRGSGRPQEDLDRQPRAGRKRCARAPRRSPNPPSGTRRPPR